MSKTSKAFEVSIMVYLIIISVLFIIALLGATFWQAKKLKAMQRQIKELIKENDTQKAVNENTNEDICFKTDKNLVITFVNDSLLRELGFKKEELIGKSIFGTLLEDNEAIFSNVHAYTAKIIKKSRIVNNELLIKNAAGQSELMLCHQRPILNEILDCEGIAFTCKNISEAKQLKEKLQELSSKDILTDTLNQDTFMQRLEQDFNRAKRYNEDFALLVVEMRDLCDFINKGISFERGDNLLKTMADLCNTKLKGKGSIGRFEKTKLGLILNKFSREKAAALAKDIYDSSKAKIKKLGVDDYNAQMLILSYTERKGFNDTFDNMLERTKRHIKNAGRRHEYGVTTSDNDKKQIALPTQYQE
mgnify:CR=1 FL=1